jgi:2-methylcitrate dehydratase PrpD
MNAPATEGLHLPDGYSRQVAAAFENWDFARLPADVAHRIKLFVLDTLGVIAAAANAEGITALNRRLSRWEPAGPSTALIGKWTASPPTAAMANGAAAHALDFDDNHDPARVHSFAVILPAALAAAEGQGGVTGRRFIAALACGVELQCRLGLASPRSLSRGWHPTTVLGTIGAAASVATLLGLRGEEFLHALGLAYHQAAGTRQALNDGALAKRLGPGFSARSGTLAAYLASDGLTGPTRFLEGEAGLFRLYEREDVLPARVLEGLGQKWDLMTHSMKPYGCCRCTHNAIDIGIAFHKEGVAADAIETVAIGMGLTNTKIVGAPFEPSRNSPVHAQFNACYCFASALVRGRVGLDSFQRPQIQDAAVAALAARARVVVDERIDPSAMSPTRVTVTLRDGRSIERFLEFMKGSPEDPMSESEVRTKFASCLRSGLDTSETVSDQLAEAVLALEELDDVKTLVALFPRMPAPRPKEIRNPQDHVRA